MKEGFLARTPFDELLRGWAKDLHDLNQLVMLTLRRTQGHALVQFVANASKAPHVNCRCVLHPQHYLWRPVKSTLNVRVYLLVFVSGAPEIYEFDAGSADVSKENVLRLQITVDNVLAAEVHKRDQDLDGKPSGQVQTESLILVVLDKVVEI